ncbi:MAG: CsgG/HfaB family protein, partial [Pseudomonadota bacterium]
MRAKLSILFLVFATVLSFQVVAKTRLAISTFENKTGSSGGSCKFSYRRFRSLGKGLKDQLTTWLVKTRRFSVQERENLKKMYNEEHKLVNSNKRYAPKANQFKAAHYSITGAITKFEMCDSDMGGDVDVGGLFGLKNAGLEVGASRTTAKVGLDIRIVDVETGEVLSAFAVSGKASSTGVSVDGDIKGADFGTEAFKNTPLGEATDKAVKKA